MGRLFWKWGKSMFFLLRDIYKSLYFNEFRNINKHWSGLIICILSVLDNVGLLCNSVYSADRKEKKVFLYLNEWNVKAIIFRLYQPFCHSTFLIPHVLTQFRFSAWVLLLLFLKDSSKSSAERWFFAFHFMH